MKRSIPIITLVLTLHAQGAPAQETFDELHLAGIPGVVMLAQAEEVTHPEGPAAGHGSSEPPFRRIATPPAVPASGTFVDRMRHIIRRGGQDGAGGLVVRFSEPEPEAQSNLEEDLAVMSRIFHKVLAEKAGPAQDTRAMGISVLFMTGEHPVRSLYLDGYGVLFTLNVNFPLMPPQPSAEERKEESQASSTWEEARRELYGNEDVIRVAPMPAAKFDVAQVNQFKDGLIEALKNATNIRGLKPDDTVAICVLGTVSPSSMDELATVVHKPGSPAKEVRIAEIVGRQSRMTETVLTIRVKKSDIDAFAKGRMDLDAFRKKATMTTYRRAAVGWEGARGPGAGADGHPIKRR